MRARLKTWLLKSSNFSETRKKYLQAHMNQCVYAAFKDRLSLRNSSILSDGLQTVLYIESQPMAHPTTTRFFPTAYRVCSYTPSYTECAPSLNSNQGLQSEPGSHDKSVEAEYPYTEYVSLSFGCVLCSLYRGSC